jgi:hypothetical protein
MNQFPTVAVVGHYQISFFGPADASKILEKTFKQPSKSPRVSPDHAAVAINKAIMRCLENVGPLLASPPFEYVKWAKKLANGLSKSLALLAPNAKAGPPDRRDWGDAYSRLFSAGRPPDITNDLLKQHGFDSSLEALNAGLFGLWFLHAHAAHAEQEWRKKSSPRSDRRTPDPLLLMWVQEMGELYSALVKPKPPLHPTKDSPFIRFCSEVGAIVIGRIAPMARAGLDDAVLRRFVETLQSERAKPDLLAEFIIRNKKQLSWGAPIPQKQIRS